MNKKAIIFGVTGQDGSYLSEFLIHKGYEVMGVIRRSSVFNTGRVDHLFEIPQKQDCFKLVYGDLNDGSRTYKIINDFKPAEVYNLAAQSHVRTSFDIPVYTVETNSVGTLKILEAIRAVDKGIKFYQASSSEMFGQVKEVPQTETTPFHPRSPYGCSKVYSYWQTVNYREAYGMFACNGILFNHESPRRGERFVTRKITRAATRIKLGFQDKLYLGNLEAKRDWGFAGDFIKAMWLMLQQDKSDDYVVATGESYSVNEFLKLAFEYLGLDYKNHVELDERYYRAAEVDILKGDYSKAKNNLGWEPSVSFEELVKMMVDSDMLIAQRELREKKYE